MFLSSDPVLQNILLVNAVVHGLNNVLHVLLKVFVLVAPYVEIHLFVIIARVDSKFGRVALALVEISHFNMRRVIRRY